MGFFSVRRGRRGVGTVTVASAAASELSPLAFERPGLDGPTAGQMPSPLPEPGTNATTLKQDFTRIVQQRTLDIAPLNGNRILGALIWHALLRDHTVLPTTHAFVHRWNEPHLHLPSKPKLHSNRSYTE